MDKKILLLNIILGLALFTAAPSQAKTINVVTTTPDLKSVAEFIGGDKVDVYSLSKGDNNAHFIQAKPSYMIKANKADLFIRNGLELEVGYESLILEGSRNPDIQFGRPGHLDASEGITPIDIPHHVDRSMGDIHASGNPHYWLDPNNMKIVAESISRKLIELSPANKTHFLNNLTLFINKIDLKMVQWRSLLAPYKDEKIITYHQSWNYFTNRFGLTVIGELEPKPGVPPSPAHLKSIVDLALREKVKVILIENFYDDKAARFVADRTGATVVIAPLSVGGGKGVDDYFTLIDTVVERFIAGIQRSRKQESNNE